MGTPAEALLRHSRRRKSSSTPSTTPNSAVCYSLLKQNVFLQDWWLIKADPDSHGRRLGVGGSTSKENQGIRIFISAPVVKRHDAVTLTTVDGITIMVHGHLNKSRTLESGFSHEVCDHFVIGFPYYWEEFAALSVDEGGHFSFSNGIFGSKATPRDNGSNMLGRTLFDDILLRYNGDSFPCSGASSEKRASSQQTKDTVSRPYETPLNHKKVTRSSSKHIGPLTRSRTRLLKKYD